MNVLYYLLLEIKSYAIYHSCSCKNTKHVILFVWIIIFQYIYEILNYNNRYIHNKNIFGLLEYIEK